MTFHSKWMDWKPANSFSSNPLDALAAAIAVEHDPVGSFIFGSLKVEEGGATAVLHGCRGDD